VKESVFLVTVDLCGALTVWASGMQVAKINNSLISGWPVHLLVQHVVQNFACLMCA